VSRDAEFVSGLIAKAPHENAPEYVKAKLSMKREELIAWLQTREGEWVNADVKVSQGGKWYVAVDDWKPDGERSRKPRDQPKRRDRAPAKPANFDDVPFDDDIPFD